MWKIIHSIFFSSFLTSLSFLIIYSHFKWQPVFSRHIVDIPLKCTFTTGWSNFFQLSRFRGGIKKLLQKKVCPRKKFLNKVESKNMLIKNVNKHYLTEWKYVNLHMLSKQFSSYKTASKETKKTMQYEPVTNLSTRSHVPRSTSSLGLFTSIKNR